jgi:preprotein translocase subunit SecE
MAKDTTTAVSGAKPSVVTRVKEFYQEVMTEMSKVTWPTKEELKSQTTVVLILLAVMSALIYFYDAIFQVFFFGLYRLVT